MRIGQWWLSYQCQLWKRCRNILLYMQARLYGRRQNMWRYRWVLRQTLPWKCYLPKYWWFVWLPMQHRLHRNWIWVPRCKRVLRWKSMRWKCKLHQSTRIIQVWMQDWFLWFWISMRWHWRMQNESMSFAGFLLKYPRIFQMHLPGWFYRRREFLPRYRRLLWRANPMSSKCNLQ